MVNSKQKGARGEREWAKVCKDHGYDCRRGQQYCGSNGDADVVGLPGIHIEVKRVEKLNLYDAIGQAICDCINTPSKEYILPIVAHRKDNHQWLVTMTAEDWFKMYKSYELERNELK